MRYTMSECKRLAGVICWTRRYGVNERCHCCIRLSALTGWLTRWNTHPR